MELPILQDIVVILGLSVLIILIFQKIKIPELLGFLLTGVIAGPYGFSLVSASHEVEMLAEIGVIFLLFVIGIEFSLKGLLSIKNAVIWGGLFQVGVTIAATTAGSYLLGMSLKEAVFMGFLISLSSTAIVLKILQERGEITSPHGRITVAILIFQDIIVVPMMLLTPLLSGESDNLMKTLLVLLGKVIVVVVVILLLARRIVPIILNLVVKTKSRELFILTVIVLCFATAWFTSSLGLSLALGAFFAGLIISESDYSHQATANILPFREIFISFFFVSIGMLLDLQFFIDHIFYVLILTIVIVLLKGVVAGLAAMVLGYPARTIFLTAVSLFQVGEFAFLLSVTGIQYDLLSRNVYQYFLAISILSMGATPFVINYGRQISEFLIRAPLPRRVKSRLSSYTKMKAQKPHLQKDYRDHLVVIGYGINGENVARAAKRADISFVVIELDPESLKKARAIDAPVVFGDASDETILRHVQIQKARVVVVAISDPGATKKIVSKVRQFTDTAYIIVRTRYLKEIEDNLKLGADEVIPEEFETSIAIFTRVLRKYLVPSDEIHSFINHIRSRNYEMLRDISGSTHKSNLMPLNIPDMDIATLRVQQGNNKVVGKNIANSELRKNFGVTVLAIERHNKFITHITPETTIEQDDILYIFGSPKNVAQLNQNLKF